MSLETARQVAWLRSNIGETVRLPGLWRSLPTVHAWLWIEDVKTGWVVWAAQALARFFGMASFLLLTYGATR